LIIDVPNAAYNGDRKFNISYSEIKDHKLGPDFNPITPMIIISNGGGYSDSMMTISIPVNVKEGDFAMAFLYDDKTGKLEGMPLLCSDGKKVVVATSNFSHSSASAFNGGAQARLDGGTEDVDKIIISAASEKDLRGNYNSDFYPGVDDLPSKNEGSSYAPSGFCNGQSEAMMWYYVKKKQAQNEPSLFKLLDNDGGTPTPKFWRDDTKAIKLASLLQNDFTITGVIRLMVFGVEIGFGSILTDRVTMNAFAYAIKLTHEPQYVGIYSGSTFPPAGHAMVVYKVGSDAMFIADPNFPGDTTRRIKYNSRESIFEAYSSASRAGGPGLDFSHIFYLAKSAMPTWPAVEGRWNEVIAGTIGNGKFPEFSIVAQNDNAEFVPLEDGFTVPRGGRLVVNIRSPGFKNSFVIYNADGDPIPADANTGSVDLPSGPQMIGINVLDYAKNRWAGFKWVKVNVIKNADVDLPLLRPTGGLVRVNLHINGIETHIDISDFAINDSYFNLHGPHSYKDGDDILYFNVSDNFHGVGEYNTAHAFWGSSIIDPKGKFTTTDQFGTLKVIKWEPGRVDVSFSFTGTDAEQIVDGKPLSVKVEGDFQFVKQ